MSEPEVMDPPASLAVVDRGTPLPVFRGAEMNEALIAYRELQKALDQSMPDQIMELDGRPFRKKGYWRAIAVAFNLTVEPIAERRDVNSKFDDGRDNFGYVVTYRASTQTGRSATGDGSCFAVEKARRFRCPHPERQGSKRTLHFPAESCPNFDPAFQWKSLPGQATEHNIRSHAHTRAFNRAVSNLVGFGEVSAEEVDRDHHETSAQIATVSAPSTRLVVDSDPKNAVPQAVIDTESGVVLPACPAGYHYLTGYSVNGQWHEATLLNWDAQGGSLKISTKYQNVSQVMDKASNENIPVKADVTVKRNNKGEAYVNKLVLYHPADDVPELTPQQRTLSEPLRDSDIPFVWIAALVAPLLGMCV